MGYVYEELLRRFSEQSGEEAGEHFTPREVIRLMVELLEIPIPDKHLSIYDPACGTGGMLSVAKEHLLDRAATESEKIKVEKYVTVHGQELSPTNYAICQADLLIKTDQQAKVFLGNSLIPHESHSKEPGDQFPEPKNRFEFMLSNPPFGVTWGGKDGYEKEARKLEKNRYQVQALGGWRTLGMVQRYSHLAPDHLQEAVERLVPAILGRTELRENFESGGSPSPGVS